MKDERKKKKISKKAQHVATLHAAEQRKVDAALAERGVIEDLIYKVTELEQRLLLLEQLGGPKGERGEKGLQGERGERGSGFWG